MWRPLSLVALSFCFMAGVSSAVGSEHGRRYINLTYGFSIVIPPGLQTSSTPPPAPQHGLVIEISPASRMWIDGSYDARFLGSARAALHDLASDEKIPPGTPLHDIRLSNLPAVRLSYKNNDGIAVRLVAYRPRAGNVAVLYIISLDTDVAHATLDEEMFNTIVRSFALRALPE